MTVASWLDDPDTWDVCTLGGIELPGVSKVTCSRARGIDVKKGSGGDLSTTTDTGYEPCAVVITLTMWTDDQWQALMGVLPLLEPDPSKGKMKPVQIAHPVTYARKVRACVIKKIDGPVGDGPHTRVMTFDCIEWNPPPKKTGAATPAVTPNSYYQAQAVFIAKQQAMAKKQYERSLTNPASAYTENGATDISKAPGWLQTFVRGGGSS